jgi:NAD(P)-dependent dehydrogenase (short-subunit alcohol dehydrogenase family)
MTERQLREWAVPDMAAEIARIQCIPDPLQAPDIAGMVLFLASDDARGCTAQEFIVDAGWT